VACPYPMRTDRPTSWPRRHGVPSLWAPSEPHGAVR